jgi:hypothetical protein
MSVRDSFVIDGSTLTDIEWTFAITDIAQKGMSLINNKNKNINNTEEEEIFRKYASIFFQTDYAKKMVAEYCNNSTSLFSKMEQIIATIQNIN